MIAESSKAFIFQEFAVKYHFGLSLYIFQHGSSLSLENVCDYWCMHQTGFSSAAVMPQSKFTELCSSAAVLSHSKFTSCVARQPLCHKVNLWSLAAPFDHDLWYFRHRTNKLFTAVIILAWTPKICLECLLWCNQLQTRSSHHRNHRQRTVSYLSRNKLFLFCFNIQSFYK